MIAAEREFLAWKNVLQATRRTWQATPQSSKNDALLMGLALARAQNWLNTRAGDLAKTERDYIDRNLARDAFERAQRQRLRRRTHQMVALISVLLLGALLGVGAVARSNQTYLKARAVMLVESIWPKVLTAAAERALKPGEHFKECADCPELVVVPGGEYMMGSLEDEKDRDVDEDPRHKVTITTAFAVSRFEATFKEWDACVLLGGCVHSASDQGWGRGTRPVINVSFDDAQKYVAWLSRRTGKPYRLLSEAEYEYAARAGSEKSYSWGDAIGRDKANCDGCGSQWDRKKTAPVGSFAANAFGLSDMQGNVFEWVLDCVHENYNGAPTNGLAWTATGDCGRRVVRGGSWLSVPRRLRSASRVRRPTDDRLSYLGFRVGRTLTP
jgi:formylglycine-generating enzyme required for sulfatase activity